MEGLLIIAAQMIFLLMGPVFAVLSAVLGLALMALTWLFAMVARLVFGLSMSAITAAGWNDKIYRAARWLGLAGIGLGGAALAALAVINAFFLDSTIRWALTQVEARSGYAVAVEEIEGDLWRAELHLRGVTLRRDASDAGPQMDLALHELAVESRLRNLLSGTARLERLKVAGLSGTLHLPATEPDPEQAPRSAPRRAFTVTDGQFTDIAITLTRGDADPLPFTITEARVAPFRSRLALFDLLFRSNLDGTVGETALRVETRPISSHGRETLWQIADLPVVQAQVLTRARPVQWLDDGRLSLTITDRWDLTGPAEIEADWALSLRDTRLRTPADAGTRERVFLSVLAPVVAAQGGQADLAFEIQLDEDGLRGSHTSDLSALWQAVVLAITRRPGVIQPTPTPPAGPAADDGAEPDAAPRLRDRLRGIVAPQD